MSDLEKLVKTSVDEIVTRDSVHSVLPSSIEDDISVLYYPSEYHWKKITNLVGKINKKWSKSFLDDGEFNIWMVAMIAIGSLFLVFVGVTIFLIW